MKISIYGNKYISLTYKYKLVNKTMINVDLCHSHYEATGNFNINFMIIAEFETNALFVVS